MARKVPVSSRKVKPGRAWWKCPYCKAGGQNLFTYREAALQASNHILARHPFRSFNPNFVDER